MADMAGDNAVGMEQLIPIRGRVWEKNVRI